MRDIHAELTDRIVAALEQGVQPWFQPWRSNTHRAGPVSRPLRENGEGYRGVNVLLLWIAAETKGYGNPFWMTYRKAQELGGQVRGGEQGSQIIVFKPGKGIDKETGEEIATAYFGTATVFNCEQIDNLPEKYHSKAPEPVEPLAPHARNAVADAFIANLAIDLRHGGGRAYYSPSQDYVQLPNFKDFHTADDYYCTAGHEAIHWTKAEKRLNRELGMKQWGDEGYAVEELVAELGSVYLAADLGIAPQPRADHASYIAVWLKVLKQDKKAIFSAAAHADRAVTYLHGLQPKSEQA